MKIFRPSLAVAAFFLLLASPSLAQPSPAPWPMFRHDAMHTGQSDLTGPRKGARRWRYRAGGDVSSPAVSSDGMIYFGANDNLLPAYNVHAVDSAGVLSWSYAVGGAVSAVALGAGGEAFFGSADTRLYGLSSGGSLLWSYGMRGDPGIATIAGDDGRVFVGSDTPDNALYAFGSTGAILWSYSDGWPIFFSPPAVGPDGRVYYGTKEGRAYSLSSNGVLEWSYATGGGIEGAAALGAGGEVYLPCTNDNLILVLDSTGALSWSYSAANRIRTSPAVGASGRIYAASDDFFIHAISSPGVLAWSYDAGGRISASSPALDSGEAVYFGTSAWPVRMYCVSSSGGLLWSYAMPEAVDSSPAIGPDGRLYVGSNDNRLYAFFDPTATPTPTAPTPTPTPTPTPGPPEAAFALGYNYDPVTWDSRILIFQRCGRRWTDVSPAGVKGYPGGVRVVSDTEAWASGTYQNESWETYILALRWDGAAWSDISPGLEGAMDDIDGIPGGGRAVGVGSHWDMISGKSWMKIWEWDGAAWTDVSPGIEGALFSVDLVSGSEGYAVGSIYDSDTWKDYVKILRWDGAAWTDISPPGVEGTLKCIRMLGPGEGLAIGMNYVDDSKTVLLRCGGGAWTDISSADGGEYNISPLSMTEAYTAGSRYDEDLETGFSVIKRWDGSSFTDISPPGVEGGLNSIWMRSSSEGCAVGGWHDPVANAPYVRILEYDGSSWIDVSPGSEGQLGSVSLGPSAGDTPTPTLTPTPTRTPTPTPTAVVCGDSFSGDTTGGTSAWEYYGGLTDWRESGPETAYRFVNDAEHDVTVDITTDEDLDIFLLSGLDPALLVRRGQGVLVKTHLPAGEYWLVVDGHEGAAGPFHLALSCTAPQATATPSPTPAITPTATPTRTATPSPSATPTGPTPAPTITPTPTPTPTSYPALTLRDLEDAAVNRPKSGEARGWKIGISEIGDEEFGAVFDSENAYEDGTATASPAQAYLRIEAQPPSYGNLGIEAGDGVSLIYDGGRYLNVCLPDLRGYYTVKLYVGSDGSTWWDPGLHRMARAACEALPTYTPTPTASPTPTPTPTAPPITLFVDFIPSFAEPPAGWTKADGEPYGTHGGWGWI